MSSILFSVAFFLTQSSGTASLEGIVIRTGTSTPISRARVTLSITQGSAATLTAITDAGGKFVFPAVQPGQYRLIANREGYIDAEYGQRGPNWPGTPITLS